MVICGDQDPFVTEKKALELSRLASNGKLYVMAGCGHNMNVELPNEINRVVVKFVQQVEMEQSARRD